MRIKKLLLLLLSLCFFVSPVFAAEYDVIIAGGGASGIAAAIQAARGGATVAVFEPTSWIGGQMTAAGVSTMDDLSRQKSGIYLEFITKINEYYAQKGKTTGTCYWDNRSIAFEPHVGQKILYEMIEETKRIKDAGKPRTIDVFTNSSIVEVKRDGKKVIGAAAEVKEKRHKKTIEISCKVLIDATEYGDVIPLAKIDYRIGNSSTPFIKMDDSMIQDITWTAVIKHYPGGVPRHLQAPFPLENYDAMKVNYQAYVTRDGLNFKGVFPVETPVNLISHNAYRAIPNSGTYVNYDGNRNNWQYISKTGVNWGNDYPGKFGWISGKSGLPASYLDDINVRKKANKEAFFKTLHFIYYLQNELDPNWSVADDEYLNNDLPPEILNDIPLEWLDIARRLPVMPYVRESRRIVGERTLTSTEILKNSLSYRDGQTSAEFPNAIAIGGYPLDLHNACSDGNLEWEFGETERSMTTNRPRGTFQVPLDILIPKNVDGFLAAEKNLSMSRLSAGAIRLQPISMMTGQAAGALAAISSKLGIPLRKVHAVTVQKMLVKHGVSISLCKYSDVPPEHPLFGDVQISNLYGLVEPLEYPHAPSYNITDLDDPKLSMAIIRGADKGVFGVDELMTNLDVENVVKRAAIALGIDADNSKLIAERSKFASKATLINYMVEVFGKNYDAKKNQKNKDEEIQHFDDVPNGHAAFSSVDCLVKMGVLRGGKAKKFNPARPVSRGEVVQLVVEMMAASIPANS